MPRWLPISANPLEKVQRPGGALGALLLACLAIATVAAVQIAMALESVADCDSRILQTRIEAAIRASTSTSPRPRPDSKALASLIAKTGCEAGMDPALLLALAERESRFDTRARGPAGSIGLLQLKLATAKAIARERGWPWRGEASLLDPGTNLRLGAAYLSKMQRRFESWEAALAAYNMGPARLRRRIAKGAPASSRYARAVLERRNELALELLPYSF